MSQRTESGWARGVKGRWALPAGGLLGLALGLVAGACDGDGAGEGDGGAGEGGAPSGGATGGAGGDPAGSGGAPSVDGRPILKRKVGFEPSSEVFRNPERGFYRYVSLLEESSLSWVDDEYSLYFSYVRLDDYRDRALDDALLSAIERGLQMVRAEHAKLILRFAYNFGPYPDSEPDASLARVREHIEALAPVVSANEDVIAVIQAGFVGAWGEWHTSTNGLTSAANKRAVWEALTEHFPASRAVQLRYPRDFWDLFGEAPLTAAEAWRGTPRSRTGHHNDCFLAGERDTGTYPGPLAPSAYKDYLADNNLFVPMGGETCALDPPRSECATALAEMEQLRFTYVNDDYHPDVIASWTSGGCREEMERRLGYRLELEELELPERVAPGAPFTVTLRLRNVGFAAPMNARPARLLLRTRAGEYAANLSGVEVRSWLPGEEFVWSGQLQLPAELAAGDYELALWLPDAASSLAADPLYAIRSANEGVWDQARGVNMLSRLLVEEGAPVEVASDPARFEELPRER